MSPTRESFAAGVILGMLAGSAAMAAFGAWAVPTPEAHRTLPRPAWGQPAPVPTDDPLGLIPPTSLPTR